MKQKKARYRKAVFCVIYKKQNKEKKENKILYLLLKRKLHWRGWEFPKGGCELKESVEKCIKREIIEETGQTSTNIKNHNVQGKYKYEKAFKDRPNIIGQTYKLYSAELKNKKIKLDKLEHSDYKFINFKKALSLLTYPNQRKCLRIVNREVAK